MGNACAHGYVVVVVVGGVGVGVGGGMGRGIGISGLETKDRRVGSSRTERRKGHAGKNECIETNLVKKVGLAEMLRDGRFGRKLSRFL